jgi:two-component system sensor histidine kinase UhpB
MRGRYASFWSYPLGGRMLAQFGFAEEHRWLPRELALLSAAAELCRSTEERRRLRSDNLRLEAEARHAEEEERRRIGRELHDEAGQALLLLRLQLEMMERDAPPGFRERLGMARGVTESVITEIRRIVSALGPQVLERLGLPAALRHLAARFQNMHPAAMEMRLPKRLPTLSADAQEAVYRVSQECLLNIAKHSCAKTVKLSLRIADSTVRLSVSDDGSGFNGHAAARRPFSYGLSGMRERAALLGGKLETETAPGKGVKVKLELPLAVTPTKTNVENSRTTD